MHNSKIDKMCEIDIGTTQLDERKQRLVAFAVDSKQTLQTLQRERRIAMCGTDNGDQSSDSEEESELTQNQAKMLATSTLSGCTVCLRQPSLFEVRLVHGHEAKEQLRTNSSMQECCEEERSPTKKYKKKSKTRTVDGDIKEWTDTQSPQPVPIYSAQARFASPTMALPSDGSSNTTPFITVTFPSRIGSLTAPHELYLKMSDKGKCLTIKRTVERKHLENNDLRPPLHVNISLRKQSRIKERNPVSFLMMHLEQANDGAPTSKPLCTWRNDASSRFYFTGDLSGIV